ncbi:CoxG family protein [Elongatibacter sediminis]|uniref:Carbon monoxide dehydrogenase subunit G n=1 Tax=Elongatibacter sediminis TaxID=3119006 RepID=A0AAW9RE38_9GAMM
MKISRTFTVDAPRQSVWTFITDAERVAQCIPGCEGARETGPGQYDAAINVKVGPIRTTFQVAIEQTEERPPEFAAYVTKGEEGSRASRISATSELELTEPSAGSTEVTYSSNINIVGRLGKFGSGMMQKIADNIGDEFVADLKNQLEGGAAPEPGTAAEVEVPERREVTVGANWGWWAVGIGAALAALLWLLL